MKRNFHFIVYILFIIATIASLILSGCKASAEADEEPTPTPLPTTAALAKPTYLVERGEVIEQIQFSGRISPAVQKPVYFHTPGRIWHVYVKRGDLVSAGQLIADLEGVDQLKRRLQTVRLNVRRAEIYAEMAQINLDLYKKDNYKWQQGYEEGLLIKERELELAQISVQEASLDFVDIQEAISATQVTAPINGTILTLSMSEGREIDAYRVVAVVADVNNLEVSCSLMSDVLNKVTEGMPVKIIPHGGIGKESSGTIRLLPYPYGSGARDSGIEGEEETTRVAFEGNPLDLDYEMGDLVYITVIINQKTDVLWLPPQAIRIFEGRRFVVIQEGELQRRVDVKIGLQSDDRIEILEGVTEGQVVVSP